MAVAAPSSLFMCLPTSPAKLGEANFPLSALKEESPVPNCVMSDVPNVVTDENPSSPMSAKEQKMVEVPTKPPPPVPAPPPSSRPASSWIYPGYVQMHNQRKVPILVGDIAKIPRPVFPEACLHQGERTPLASNVEPGVGCDGEIRLRAENCNGRPFQLGIQSAREKEELGHAMNNYK